MNEPDFKYGMRVEYAKDTRGDGPGTVKLIDLGLVFVVFDASPRIWVGCYPSDLVESKPEDSQ